MTEKRTDAEGGSETDGIDEAASQQFVKDVVARGEAAYPDEDGKLPPGATHEIVEERDGELPTIRRRRFSLLDE